jgi:DNA-binding LacI/PurR family transcriptional regulator
MIVDTHENRDGKPLKSIETSTTITDIAEALGLSVSTVSRALSGKGRISEETSNRVKAYMEGHDYKPNMLAKGLANGRSYSICAVLPSDAVTGQIPFFYECLMGICSAGMKSNYTTMIVTDREDRTGRLKSVVSMGKADGYILLRAADNDPALKLLMDKKCRTVVVGNPGVDNVEFVDEDHKGVCESFTSEVLRRGIKAPAAIIGAQKYNVNRSRKQGFEAAVMKKGIKSNVFTVSGNADIEEAVQTLIGSGADCIFCGDDTICLKVLELFGSRKRPLLTSFYYSEALAVSGIEAPRFNARELGRRAADILIENIENRF